MSGKHSKHQRVSLQLLQTRKTSEVSTPIKQVLSLKTSLAV